MRASVSVTSFGPFELDVAEVRLLRDKRPIELRLRAFRVLQTLAQRQNQFVDYETLMETAWEGDRVSRHTVAVTIGEIKKALDDYGAWIQCRPKLGYCLGAPPCDELTQMGSHYMSQRTRDGLDKAIECFEEALTQSAADRIAAEGLVSCHLMLGTVGMREPRIVYPRFLAALQYAVNLMGMTPELRCARAHALHMFERKCDEAEQEMMRARAEAPRLPSTYVRLALMLSTSGRLRDAWAALEQAELIAPLWPLLPATEVCIRFCSRDYEGAILCGERATRLHPYLSLGRVFYAQALEYSGRVDEALAQHRLACIMTPDLSWLFALKVAALARNRRPEAADAFAELIERRKTEYIDAYYMALAFDALGHRDLAFAELERALEENSTTLPVVSVDPRLDGIRTDPRFDDWHRRVFAGSSPWLNDLAARYADVDGVERLAVSHK